MPRPKGCPDLSVKDKLSLIDRCKSVQVLNPKMSKAEIARILGVHGHSLRKFLKEENDLRERAKCNPHRKRVKDGKNPDVERALAKWHSIMVANSVRVNGPVMREKALEFAIKLGYLDFKPTDGWFNRWKKRNNINLAYENHTVDGCYVHCSIVENMDEEERIEVALGSILEDRKNKPAQEGSLQSEDMQSHLLQTMLERSEAPNHVNNEHEIMHVTKANPSNKIIDTELVDKIVENILQDSTRAAECKETALERDDHMSKKKMGIVGVSRNLEEKRQVLGEESRVEAEILQGNESSGEE